MEADLASCSPYSGPHVEELADLLVVRVVVHGVQVQVHGVQDHSIRDVQARISLAIVDGWSGI